MVLQIAWNFIFVDVGGFAAHYCKADLFTKMKGEYKFILGGTKGHHVVSILVKLPALLWGFRALRGLSKSAALFVQAVMCLFSFSLCMPCLIKLKLFPKRGRNQVASRLSQPLWPRAKFCPAERDLPSDVSTVPHITIVIPSYSIQ